MREVGLIFIVAFLFACGTEESSEIQTDSGSLMQSDELNHCFCNELVTDSSGIYSLNDSLYTGVCVEYYPNTEDKYIEKNILSGKIHGKVIYYDRSGEVLFEEIYKEGNKKRSGENEVLNVDCSELEKIEATIPNAPNRYLLDGIPYTGSCEERYPESNQVYMTHHYKNGVLNGRSIYYKRDGSTLYIEKYEMGQLVNTIH
ncbi:MAG: hypothetical protein WDZ35_04155 [Crocinitomicaceae bacterium]